MAVTLVILTCILCFGFGYYLGADSEKKIIYQLLSDSSVDLNMMTNASADEYREFCSELIYDLYLELGDRG